MGQGSRVMGQGYKRLLAWQKADDLACAIFQMTGHLPEQLRWLANQMNRAAVSVPANIAEGYSRDSAKEYLRFLHIARGSLAELEYYLHFVSRNELASADSLKQLDELRREVGSLLFGLIQSLKAKVTERTAAASVLKEGPGLYGYVSGDSDP